MPSNDLATQLKTLLKNLTPAKKIALFTLVTGTVISLIFLVTWAGKPDFQLLYSNLASEDAGAILAQLKDKKIPYQISSNGSSILIPSEQIYETRLELASQGIPQGSGVGFEIFDNTKLGMTEFVQNVNYQRAIQGELSRTINGFSEIESSRVHIVMPSKSLFIEEEEAATASVVLKVRSGRRLNEEKIQGIVHLVSSSVSGLSPENVTIVDSYGKMLAGFKSNSPIGKTNSDQLEFQQKVEKTLEDRVTTMLETALGPNKAVARVSCLLDFTKLETTEEKYQPENQVIRSEQALNETSTAQITVPIGVPGVVSNLAENQTPTTDTTKPAETTSTNATSENTKPPTFQKQDRTVNYEIGKVISHTVEPVGTIKRLSVAVIVDGTYKSEKAGRGQEELKYLPRTQEEMKQFEDIVKRAVNFSAARGDEIKVANIPFETAKLNFSQGEEAVPEAGWLLMLKQYSSHIKYGLLTMFLLFSFIFVVRPLVQWLISSSIGEGFLLGQLPKTLEEVEREYGGDLKNLPFRNRALQMISSDKERSAEVMQNWLKES
jgi:flagellar M-ring protein FliF